MHDAQNLFFSWPHGLNPKIVKKMVFGHENFLKIQLKNYKLEEKETFCLENEKVLSNIYMVNSLVLELVILD